MKIDYDYFDFHSQYKRGGGAAMDQYVNDQLKNLYMGQIQYFHEHTTNTYSSEDDSL